jgi:hypothetical protein
MKTEQQTRPWIRLCTAVLAGGGLALSAFGLGVGTAQAVPAPAPTYHWCPGDGWDGGWGPYQNWHECHDWDGPAPMGYGAPPPMGYGGPPPWAPPPPAPPFWAPWANVVWDPGHNAWGFWNNGLWMGI